MLLDISKLPTENRKLVKPNIRNVDLEKKAFSDRLNSIGELSSNEIRNIILSNYVLFLDNNYIKDNKSIIDIFKNTTFVSEMISVVKEINLSDTQKISLNKICWYSLKDSNIDKETKELLLQLSYSVNKQIVQVLSAKVPIYWAKMIALARYSSSSKSKQIRRVNSIIISMELVDLQLIVDLFSILFNDCLTELFISIALDIRDYSIMNETQIYTDKLLSIAVFEILNNVPTELVNTVLTNYSEMLKLGNYKVRFELNCSQFKNKYKRVANSIDFLLQNGAIIP